MKRRVFQFLSLVMALNVLFVAHGFSVNFHRCTEDHHLMSSFGDASLLCEHCMEHHHHGHLDADAFEEHLRVVHFGAKCCCEDFEREIGFTDDYTFSTEKHLVVCPVSTLLADVFQMVLDKASALDARGWVHEKIPYLSTGRLRTLFFSNLKLNPLVF